MQNFISLIENNLIGKVVFNQKYFRLLFLLSVILRVNPFVEQFIGPVTKVFIVWGLLLIMHDLFTKRNILHKKFNLILYTFLIFYGISILVNYKNNLVANVISYAYIFIKMVVLYIYDKQRNKNDLIKEIDQANNLFISVAFGGALLSIIMVMCNIHFRYGVGEFLYEAGIRKGRLWGFFQNPNAAGSIASIAIILTLCSFMIKGKNINRKLCIYYIVNIFLQLINLFLTGSRGAMISFTSFLIIVGILFFIKSISKRKDKFSIVNMLLSVVVVIAILMSTSFFAKHIIPKISIHNPKINHYLWGLEGIEPPIGVSIDGNNGEDDIINNKEDVIDRESSGEDVVGGRKALWSVGLMVAKKHPIFGVGDENVIDFAYAMQPDNMELHGLKGGGMHNFMVQTAVASGFVGLAIIIVFMVVFTITIIKYIIKMVKAKQFNNISLVIISLLISLVVNGMVESGIIFNTVFSSIILWMYMGYLMYFVETDIK